MGSNLLHARHWVGGEWIDASQISDSINPATGEKIGTYTEASADEAARAIAVALKAFKDTEWSGNRRPRAQALNETGSRQEPMIWSRYSCWKTAKSKRRRFEVSMVPSKLRFYAALALTDYGRVIETAPGRFATTLREPAGVAFSLPGTRRSCSSSAPWLPHLPQAALRLENFPASAHRPMHRCVRCLQK